MSEALYPPLDAGARGHLEVTAGHRIYFETCGPGDGVPALFLHGGPGSSIAPVHRRFFDPAFYRTVLFDQRGCGQSTPRGATEHNTTADLIDDIERLRQHLGVQRWMLFGGSWGSTLALAYAQRHPQQVSGMVLRGVFVATREEVDWFLRGLQRFLPEAADALHAGAAEGTDLVAHYAALLASPDAPVALAAAQRWSAYESAVMAVGESPAGSGGADAGSVLARVRVQLHYLAHDCFLAPGQLLAAAGALHSLPAILVQGRRDLVCPPATAYTLARSWPSAQLRMVEDGGHSALHPAMSAALVRATDDMRQMLRR